MWPLYRNIGTACLGAFILLWQTVAEITAQPILVGAGLALLGVTAADWSSRYVNRRLNGKENGS